MDTTAEGLLARMTALLSEWDDAGDRRAVFLRCYVDETRSVMAAIAEGRFHNGRWVNDLMVRFITYYFDALDAYEGGGTPPEVWHWAFHLAPLRLTTVSEDLLLGINAHISRDLPLVVRDSLKAEGVEMSADEQARRLADFAVVNRLIAETAKVAEKDVLERYSRVMRLACVACRPFVPSVRWSIEQVLYSWRDHAWETSLRLLAEPDAARLGELELEIERHAVERVHIVLHATEDEAHLLHTAHRGLAELERSRFGRRALCDEHRIRTARHLRAVRASPSRRKARRWRPSKSTSRWRAQRERCSTASTTSPSC